MLVFSNVLVGNFREEKGQDMRVKPVSIIAGAAIASTIGITVLQKDSSLETSNEVQHSISTRGVKKTCQIESAFAVGMIQGWPTMIFVNEDVNKTNAQDRLESHVGKGVSRILSYNKISAPPSGSTLTLFTSTDKESGWNVAYPTAPEKQSATNALMVACSCHVKGMTNIPDGCLVALGWLCYVTNGFWDVHTSPVNFSEIANLKGGWLYRERR